MFDENVSQAFAEAARKGELLESVERVDAIARVWPKHLRDQRVTRVTGARQLRADLAILQALDKTEDNLRIFADYLDRAQSQAAANGFAELQKVRELVFGHQRSFQPIDPHKQFPERIVLRDVTLPIDFLRRGAAAAASVGKMVVPVYQSGVRDGSAHARGTAWLLTPKHVVTCLHVLHARETGRATDADLALQVALATVNFDGQTDHAAKAISAGWEDLDVAIVELAASISGPSPLACRVARPPKPTDELGFFVNLIQFPRGEQKRVGLRANAALDVTDRDLYYFTDTEQGSSGCPCFDDDWNVIAVHRAWEVRQGVQYMGRTVGFANVGSVIANVLDRLAADHPDICARVQSA